MVSVNDLYLELEELDEILHLIKAITAYLGNDIEDLNIKSSFEDIDRMIRIECLLRELVEKAITKFDFIRKIEISK